MRILRKDVVIHLLLLCITGLTACSEENNVVTGAGEGIQGDPWAPYLRQHATGLISRQAPVQISFLVDVASAEDVGNSAAAVMSIEPAINAAVTFVSPKEISIVPAQQWQPGQSYNLQLLPDRLSGVPDDLPPYRFTVNVIRQAFAITVERMDSVGAAGKAFNVTGALSTADIADAQAVEAMLKAQYLGRDVALVWKHNSNQRQHEFHIAGVERQPSAAELVLKYQGAGIGVNEAGEQKLTIPALGQFAVAQIRAIAQDRQYVLVELSDPVATNQDISGLVTLEGSGSTVERHGNSLRIYPETSLQGKIKVVIDAGLRNKQGKQLSARVEQLVFFSSQKPQVRFVGKGVILPRNPVLSIPFEAMNAHTVQVTAFQIFSDNIGQFLQQNRLDGDYELQRVGRYLWRRTIALPNPAVDKWSRYELDATALLKEHPGSLFRLTLSINRGDTLLSCGEDDVAVPVRQEPPPVNQEDESVEQSSGWDFATQYYGGDYDQLWKDRANPCKDAYYDYADGVQVHRNFMASNIGIIAKRNDRNDMRIITTDLGSAKPMPGVALKLFNYQNQQVGSASTDSDGFAALQLGSAPYYMLAVKGEEQGYLKLSSGSSLATSHFDVAGESAGAGIKGFIYGERGVWRPGDDIHLTFVLFDKDDRIPDQHPVTLHLYNPKGQLMQSLTNAQPVDDFYVFTLRTAEDAPTGSWEVRALVGGATFNRKLKIETVKPNRLKVEMELGPERLALAQMPVQGKLFAQWLHGATAGNMKAEVRVKLRPKSTRFTTFSDYSFDDPAREFSGEQQELFTGTLDEQGYANLQANIQADKSMAPGRLQAYFDLKVFEPGGDFSISTSSKEFDAFETYVGIKPPAGDAARNMLLTDTRHKVAVATVDAEGKPVSREKIQMRLYKLDWKWWWDKSGESLAQYASASYSSVLQEGIISTSEGRGSWEFEIKYPDWGRYLLRACDLQSEHCSGQIVYVDWPGWAGKEKEQSGAGANSLTFLTDKKDYQVGEQVQIQLPEATQGRALYTVETASRIVHQQWLEFDMQKTPPLSLTVTPEMSPTAYISITLLQPHGGRDNDRPLRMYGIAPINVQDPASHLQPVITADQEWRPLQPVSLDVHESAGRAMSYTLAVVDEGLLGLTAFRTPDLHQQFYRKEALGIATWDLFDDVAGAYSGQLDNLLALGGSDAADAGDQGRQKRRFPPVVQFLGPFQLAEGARNTHNLALPQYLGAVRVMVVAGHKGAYGSADTSVFVREPLSLLATVPRVLGPEELVTIPVNLFVMDESITEVKVQVSADEHFHQDFVQPPAVKFDKPGDKLGFITLRVASLIGKGRINVTAQGGKFSSSTEVFLDIRSANTPSTRISRALIEPGEQWSALVKPHGLPGTNRVLLETSVAPPLNLDSRLQYLVRYPHGCLEQVTSAVFPQLYLDKLLKLDEPTRKQVDEHVHAAIARLRQFQNAGGGFTYWPGQQQINEWATNYAGHFLIAAQTKGYPVPADMLQAWLGYQQSRAQNWVAGSGVSQLNQVYRLYTLALIGQASVAAMNRMREAKQLSNVARWQLAAAYHLAGMADAAGEITRGRDYSVSEYAGVDDTFGSRLRDQAIILESLASQQRLLEAKAVADDIAQALATERWFSTQSVAYSLLAMSRYLGGQKGGTAFQFTMQRDTQAAQTVQSDATMHAQELPDVDLAGEQLTLRNTAKLPLYATVYASGVPHAGEELAASEGMGLEVSYYDAKDKPLAVTKIPQGTGFLARIQVRNTSSRALKFLALSQVVPSGWEIDNERLGAAAEDMARDVDYQDIRDDRVLTYFELDAGASRTFESRLTATYLGRYYLPGVHVEAMYEVDKSARTKGQWVEVVAAP